MIKIDKESFTPELFAEIVPLAQKCWNESTLAKGEACAFFGERDFDIEPDMDVYQDMGNKGRFVAITLRDEGELKGYVVGFTHMGIHHKKIVCGYGDSIYIEPEYRSHARTLVADFEEEFRKRGVQIIGWPVTPEGPIHKLLKTRGYVVDDVVLEKRLCA